MGTQLPSPIKGHSPQFSAHICCGQTAAWIKMPLGTEVGLCPGDFVLDGDPAPFPQKGGGASRSPQFSAHVYCGQTAGWVNMVFGIEVGLRPGNFVLDGLGTKMGGAPNFRPTSIVVKRLHGSRCHLVRR